MIQLIGVFRVLLSLRLCRICSALGIPSAFCLRVNRTKRCVVSAISPGRLLFTGRFHKEGGQRKRLPEWAIARVEREMELCLKRGVQIFVWGSTDRSAGIDVSGVERRVSSVGGGSCFFLEVGLFGSGPECEEDHFSFVADRKAPYFDGRRPTDLEDTLNALGKSGTRSALDPERTTLLDSIRNSRFQKYQGYDSELDIQIQKEDFIAIGQCAGDAAWVQTNSLLNCNLDLVRESLKIKGDARLFYKPHPRNSTNESDLAQLRQEFPEVQVIPPEVSFADIAHRKPNIVVNTSGAGFEAAIRGCRVYTFGTSFYSNWGFTVDAVPCERRHARITANELLSVLVFDYIKYVDRMSGKRLSAFEVAERIGISARAPHSLTADPDVPEAESIPA